MQRRRVNRVGAEKKRKKRKEKKRKESLTQRHRVHREE
jgi:hypothetical protein